MVEKLFEELSELPEVCVLNNGIDIDIYIVILTVSVMVWQQWWKNIRQEMDIQHVCGIILENVR